MNPFPSFLRAPAGALLLFASSICLPRVRADPAPAANRVTILYDAFGKDAALTKDWGFAALIEYEGHRILFDTGNNAAIFADNVSKLGIDLQHLDFVVISHRHGDHTAGLAHVLKVNPTVPVYAPYEVSGFGTVVLPGIVAAMNRHDPTLPPYMHYFDGVHQAPRPSGSPWPTAHFETVVSTTNVAPDIYILSTISDVAGTKEMHELSLLIRSREGGILVVGCSHPGIEKIVAEATAIDPHISLLVGGLHLVSTPDAEVERIATALHDRWQISRVAPGHCTGVPAFADLSRIYGDKYTYAGLGSVIPLP